jgi:uncharacterized protein YndB with AHSA1/START domain
MPIKKNETGKRWVEMELLVPGTPEQVWQAIATGPGNACWFTKGEIEPRVGGAFRLDFGQGATTAGEVTTWEPPRQFGYVERDWEKGAPPVATEITITARSGDRCVVRMVHSLFASSDDWDDQLEGFESGWPGFFAVLRVYLAHFAGTPGSSFMVMQPSAAKDLAVWRRLCEALPMNGVNVGEVSKASAGPEPWSGTVELVHQDSKQRYVLLRLDAPSPGALLVGTYLKADETTSVSVGRFYYGTNANDLVAESEPRWREWLGKTFAS